MPGKNKTEIKAEPGKQELFAIREFDAPRDLVWKALTDPKLIAKWLGPRNLTTKIDRYESKAGGFYRYVQTDAKGNEYAFRGVIHEMVKPERVIQTFEFEGLPEKGHVILETMRLEQLPGNRTRLVTQSLFQSVADRDGMVHAGMESGVVESYERLDEIFENELVSL